AIARQGTKLSQAMARAERIGEVLEADALMADRPDAHRGPRAQGDVVLDDVSFAYEPDRPALRGLTLRIGAGEKVALVGRSGAGKATVGALVARFFDASSGRVALVVLDLRVF